MTEYEYTLIRSDRRSISLEISNDISLIVRAPLRMKKEDIALFVRKHESWILKHLEKRKNQVELKSELSPGRIEELKKAAMEYLPQRTAYFAEIMGLNPASVKITAAKKRFGSCSAKNGICFSRYLMLYPPAAVDCVIVHELAHIRHKNHGKDFYALIQRYLPDYREKIKILNSTK